MADVAAGGRRDRGQLILVTGLLVAVTMVSLVLLLNTAIYTENLASRGTDQSGREAVEYRGTTVEAVHELVVAENAREQGDWASVRDATRDGILLVDNRTGRRYAARGTVVSLNRSGVTLHEGRLVRQTNSSREFTNASGTATGWTLAENVDGVRSFTMNVSDDRLTRANESDAASKPTFQVRLEDGVDVWWVVIYEDWSTGDVTVATHDGATTQERCSVGSGPAVLNLSDGTLDGQSCGGYAWAEGVTTPYDVSYQNGDAVNGTYALTANGTDVEVAANLNDGATDTSSPYFVPAVYSVAFDVHYETPTLTYRVAVRVAPGEPA